MTPEHSLQLLDLPVGTTNGWIRQLREPHRHYHTLDHIQAMLENLPEQHESKEIVAAIWLHDIIYDPKASDNEEASAEQASVDLRESGIDVPTVMQLIIGTKHHEPGSAAQNILNDLDLGILGQPRGIYEEYARRIRLEYAHVPIELYRPGRASILRQFNERQIYHTAIGCDLEENAHAKLRWEIEQLERPA